MARKFKFIWFLQGKGINNLGCYWIIKDIKKETPEEFLASILYNKLHGVKEDNVFSWKVNIIISKMK